MFFYITLHSLTPIALVDNKFDPLDKRAELYQTWALAALEDATDMNAKAKWGRQGFSTRRAPGGATSIAKPRPNEPPKPVRVIDPQVTFAVPDDEDVLYRFDAHYWESDSSKATKKVRALFTDRTLKYMNAAWVAASEDRDKATKDLLRWIDDNWQDIVLGLVSYGTPAAAGVISQFNVLELLEAIVRVAANGADDYHQHHRFVLQMQRSPKMRWRVISPSMSAGAEWSTEFGTREVTEIVSADGGKTRYQARWRFRMLES